MAEIPPKLLHHYHTISKLSTTSRPDMCGFMTLPPELRFEVFRSCSAFTLLQLSHTSTALRNDINASNEILHASPGYGPAPGGTKNLSLYNVHHLNSHAEARLFKALYVEDMDEFDGDSKRESGDHGDHGLHHGQQVEERAVHGDSREGGESGHFLQDGCIGPVNPGEDMVFLVGRRATGSKWVVLCFCRAVGLCSKFTEPDLMQDSRLVE